jgi:hypothetical protein
MLKEIHKSKNSYCSYLNPEDSDFDIIILTLDKINAHTIEQAKQNRAERLARRAWMTTVDAGEIRRLDEFAIDPSTIEKTDLVFRVITYEPVPLAPGCKKIPKNTQDSYAKLNFPPFQHWKITEADEPYLVGKSHWVGGLSNGHFDVTHGKMTNKLAKMFMMMCERYGSKWNWRGYTYNDEMKSQALLQLSQVGLQFDESKSENPFAYYTAAVTNSFTRVLNLEKKSQNIRDDLLEEAGLTPSLTRQNSQEYAEEIARQAELYKNMRMPKSKDSDFVNGDETDEQAEA